MIRDEVVAACSPWSAILRTGQSLQIVDLHGNQAVDTLFYAVDGDTVDPAGRYSAQATVAAQKQHLPDHRLGAARRRRQRRW